MTNKINLQDLLDQKAATAHPNAFYLPDSDARAKMSEAARQRTVSDETRAKMSASHLGRRTQGMTGRKHTEDTRAKMSATAKQTCWNKGQQLSADIRANMSKAATLRREKYARGVMTPHGYFPHVLAVAEAAGVGKAAVYQWIKKYPNDYYYVEK